MLSQAMEDYLAAIYRAAAGGERAATSDVARRLKVSSASTTHMFHKMAEEGLVEYREYEGVNLTDKGKLAATALIRRHRLAERFLTDVLGIAWDKVDVMADRLEHALPPEVVDGFDALLGGPRTCPHGYPIPARDGTVEELETRPLGALKPGESGEIACVREDDSALLQYLGAQGLVPGARVTVVARNPVDDLIEVEVGDHRLTVGRRVAEAVAVRDGVA